MSGGRGRGRGGYKPPTGAQLMLQRSAQESGLDERNLKTIQDLTKPTLFPDHLWHSSEGTTTKPSPVVSEQQQLAGINAPVIPIVQPKRTASEIYKIRKAREFQHHMHLSPFYLRPSLEVDVVRHMANNKRARTETAKACDKAVMEHLGTVATPRFVPPELLMPKGPPKRSGKSANGAAGAVLLDDDMEEKGEGEEDGEDVDEYLEPEEDEDEGEDYAKDYYASDNDSDGGGDGDGEPTF
jgi:hypothetical protein